MILPKFKPSTHFFADAPEDESFPCLIATLRNSRLPGIGKHHIALRKRDPECVIRIRGRKAHRISAWQQKVLQSLLQEKGLSNAIEKGITQYQTDPKSVWVGYDGLDERQLELLRRDGVATFVIVTEIIIDEVQREVLLRLSSILDSNIMEHGAIIHRRGKKKWRFDYEDYFGHYKERLYKETSDLQRLRKQRLKKEYLEWRKNPSAELAEMAKIMKYLPKLPKRRAR